METNNHNQKFNIRVDLKNGGAKDIEVTPDETTDGVPHYTLEINGKKIQLRRDEDSKWELMWGELAEEDVQAIGEQITSGLPA